MSVTADVVLAAGPSVVALAALGSAAWQQRRGLQHAREMTDLALVREMLDEAAKALHRGSYAREGIWRVGPAAAANTDGVATELAKAGTALDELVERLTIRLGAMSSVVLEFTAAADALRAIEVEIHRPNADPAKQFAAFQAASDAFNAGRTAFQAAAARTAGVRLP